MFKKTDPLLHNDTELVDAMIGFGERPYCLSQFKDEIVKAQPDTKKQPQPVVASEQSMRVLGI